MVKQDYLSPLPKPPAIRAAIAKASERKDKGLPVYDFGSGNIGMLPMNLKLFDSIELEVSGNLPDELRIIAEGIKKGFAESFQPNPKGLSYSPTGGSITIKKAAIHFFKMFHGLPLSEEDLDRVIVTPGGQLALTSCLRSLKRGTEVLLRRWEYEPVPAILEERGLKEVRVEVGEDLKINIQDLESKLKKNQVFYVSMPNNPTGYVSPDELEDITKLLVENEGGVIWDAPYLFILLRIRKRKAYFDKEFLKETLEKFKNIARKYHESMCILSSMSKTGLIAGIRFGFATASKHWIANMEALLGRETLSSPTLSFEIGKNLLDYFLDNPITHEWSCKVLAERLTFLMEELGDFLLIPKDSFGGLYVLLKTPEDGSVYAEKLLNEHGIITVPGEGFYGAPVNAVRLSLVAIPWSEGDGLWLEAVKILSKALKK